MSVRELLELDAVEQAAKIRAGEVTSAELVEAAIENIEAVNPAINAVVIKTYEQALEAARTAPPTAGPFAGVPTLLKDLRAEAKGMPRTSGSRYLLGHVDAIDAVVVSKLRESGLLFLGRTAAPELGLGPATEPELYGPCRNPWNTDYGVGGSSGGAAAAVAAGIVSIAHASDGGGSIRQPAATCGVVGLKPTRGRVSLGPTLGESPAGLSIEGVVSRSVVDTAVGLDVVSGPGVGDPYYAPPPAEPFAEAVKRPPARLRIAFSGATFHGNPLHPEVQAGLEAAAKACEGLGHIVEEAAPDFDAMGMFEALFVVNASNRAFLIADIEQSLGRPPKPGEISPLIEGMLVRAKEISASQYLQAVARLHRISRKYCAFFEDYDVLLTPVMSTPPVRVGEFDMERGGDSKEMRARMAEYAPFPKPANVTGLPAISLPLHWTADGLPVGMQFTGRYADEFTLLQLSKQLEEAMPWKDRRPPVWAPTTPLPA